MRQGFPTDNLDPNVDKFNTIEPHITLDDSVEAAFDEAHNDTFVMQMARRDSLKELQNNGMKDLTPEDANKLYPGMEVPFNKPVNPLVAREVFDRHAEALERQRKIENGPKGFIASVSRFGAGMLAHVMDPVETAVGFIAGAGAGKALGAVSSKFAASAAGKLTGEVAGNFVQAAGTEALNKDISQKEQRAYDPTDMMTNIAMNTFAAPLGFAGLRLGIKGGKFAFGKVSEMFSNLSPEHSQLVAQSVVNNLENNIMPDIEPVKQKIAMDTNIKPEDMQGVGGKNAYYNFEKANSLEGKTMYVSPMVILP